MREEGCARLLTYGHVARSLPPLARPNSPSGLAAQGHDRGDHNIILHDREKVTKGVDVHVFARGGCNRARRPRLLSRPSGQAEAASRSNPSLFVTSRTGAMLLIGSSFRCRAHRR